MNPRRVTSSQARLAFWLCSALSLAGAGAAGCKGASAGCSGQSASSDAGVPRLDAQVKREPDADVKREPGVDLSGIGKRVEVLFVGGFMSQLYTEMSRHLEDEVNASLRDSARELNVHIDLPLDKSIHIPVGDAIADALPRVELPLEEGGFETFYSQMRFFDAEGVAYRNMADASKAFGTGRSVQDNAAAIRAVLRRTKKRVVIVSHSKGGLDTLEALIHAPELWGKPVVGWVALQAPFYGSPIADSTTASLNGLLLESLGGDRQSAEDLKTKRRAAYMEANEARIEKLAKRVPIITAYSTYEGNGSVTGFAGAYASSIFNAGLVSEISRIVTRSYRETPRDIPRVLTASSAAAAELIRERVAQALGEAVATIGVVDLTNAYMNGVLDLPNDGLVPLASTRLPGAVHSA
ncbi:MAG: hypothetical protein ACN4G0_14340, partial [Polyangiales bacterium]